MVDGLAHYAEKVGDTQQFQIIHFSIRTQFKCKYGLIAKNISILNNSV